MASWTTQNLTKKLGSIAAKFITINVDIASTKTIKVNNLSYRYNPDTIYFVHILFLVIKWLSDFPLS
jgi:hypothetical protein